MNRLFEILDLLNQRDYYLSKLKSMKFGSIEVRENKDHKYIYTHYQLDKDSGTMYIGEYSDDLYNQTIENNNEAKKYKKELRRINKRLNDLDFNDSELSDKVKWNIDLARKMLPDTVYKQAILEGKEENDLNDLLKKLLTEDKDKRIDWNDYFNHRFFSDE